MSSMDRPVLVLGGGINGASVARDLVMNGVPVWLVERDDLAAGATSRSSRLIHGGLRYLEYGDFRLVGESLDERARLRALAPQFVRPLRLYIPVARRTGGLARAAARFLGSARSKWLGRLTAPFRQERGLWTVRLGLTLYDWLSRGDEFEPHRVQGAGAGEGPAIDASRYRWLCGYSDAQMVYPERYVLALLHDARHLAAEQGIEFRVLTHHEVSLDGTQVRLRDAAGQLVHAVRPPVVVNATGAWGDLTLERLDVPSPRLFGGTKGSHFVTFHAGLLAALGEAGLYAEAADGRLVFVLPFGEGVLVGTTDERFEGDPAEAAASAEELDYLLGMVNSLFADVRLTRGDIAMHYSGVRPLPAVSGTKTGAISRDHWIEESECGGLPVLTLVGGKLTTSRAFGELAADRVLELLGAGRRGDTRERVVPGGGGFPSSAGERDEVWRRLGDEFGLSRPQVAAVWSLCGTEAASIFRDIGGGPGGSVAGTDLPVDFVRWVVKNEWVSTLADLVERRLMLVYCRTLTEESLRELAAVLVEEGALPASLMDEAVLGAGDRLRSVYGRSLASEASLPASARR